MKTTTATSCGVYVVEISENDLHPLFHQYANQQSPQRAFLCLDTEARTLSANWYGEIGGGCFARTWDGRDLEFSINPDLTAREINELMREIAPMCAALLGESDADPAIFSRNSNKIYEIERACEITTESGGTWDAAQFFEGGPAPESREEALALAADYEGGVTLTDLDDFLQAKKEETE